MIASGDPPDRGAARPHPKPAPRAPRPAGERTSAASLRLDAAERIAIRALGYIAADGERLDRFMALSGLEPDRLREAAAAPAFLASVLDHLAADEAALTDFAAEAGLAPQTVAAARAALSPDGGPGERLR
jgi:hypothetical protein